MRNLLIIVACFISVQAFGQSNKPLTLLKTPTGVHIGAATGILDTFASVRTTGIIDGQLFVWNASLKKLVPGWRGLQDSLSKKVNRSFDNVNPEKYSVLDTATEDNRRNSQASTIRLNDSTLMTAYTHTGSVSSDLANSQIWYVLSYDNGETFTQPTLLLAEIDGGAVGKPSLRIMDSGNIQMMFWKIDVATEPYESRIFKAEFTPSLTIVGTPSEALTLSTGYRPIASDRFFKDTINNKILFPYPQLISGSGQSATSLYEGRMLVSSDDGTTWTDAGISIGSDLVREHNGTGGATEPGLYYTQNTGLVYYYRTLLGYVYSNVLTGSTYVPGTNTKLYTASNAQSSIKYWPAKSMLVAVSMRVNDFQPATTNTRQDMDILTSLDGVQWNRITQLDYANPTNVMNEPNIYVDDKYFLVTYCKTFPTNTNTNLVAKRFLSAFIENSYAPAIDWPYVDTDGNYYNGGYQVNPEASSQRYIVKVQNPKDGWYFKESGDATGAIRIKVPTGTVSYLVVKGTVYGRTSKAFTFEISFLADNFSPTYNTALIKTSTGAEYNVRFYEDGANRYIYIGELATVWNYLGVTIDEVSAFRQSRLIELSSGWKISLETTFSGTLRDTKLAAATLPYSNLAQPITGYVAGANTALAATDTKLAALGKIQGQITARATLASPTFTGTPTLPTGTIAVTQTAGNSTTAVATTAFVTTANNLKANIASPTFTGTPSLPTGTIGVTQTAGNSTTALATTAFVTTANNLKANITSPTFSGTVTIPALTIPTGAVAGRVWTSDGVGGGSWQPIGSSYKGTWDASTNTPTLTDGVGTLGDFYFVSTGGTQFGRTFVAGGQAIYNGSIWQAVGAASGVTSFASRTGAITPLVGDYSSFFPLLNGSGATGTWGIGISGNAATATLASNVTTNANLTGPVTSVGNATAIANGAISNAMLANGAVANLSGTNTGDQTTITGNAGTATALQTARDINGVAFDGTASITVTADASTLTGSSLPAGVTSSSLTSVGTLTDLTVTNPIAGSITGNAATVTTNANLSGDVTSTGNVTSIASGAILNADVNASAAIDATKIANGTVTNAEFQYIGGLTSDAQTQINAKGIGSVTGVSAGNGMNFATITGTGSVVMGTPGATTLSSTNAVTTNSHTHAFTPGGTSGQLIRGDGTLATIPTGASDLAVGTRTTTTLPVTNTNGTGVTLPVATTSLAGLQSSADKTKLDGIATGATANSSDATLLARANHTGTQTASTISDFSTAVAATAAVTANTAKVTNATHTGDVTGATALTIANSVVTLAKMANVATGTVFYRKTASAGAPEVQTLATLKTDLAVSKSDVGLSNVDNTSDLSKPVSTATQTAIDAKVSDNLTASTTVAPSKTAVNTALALKANLASPAFTGTPTVPTATAGTNTTQAASTAYVDAAVTASAGNSWATTGSQTGLSGSKSGTYNLLTSGGITSNNSVTASAGGGSIQMVAAASPDLNFNRDVIGANGYINYSTASTTLWRVGLKASTDNYVIRNNTTSTDALSIDNSTNNATFTGNITAANLSSGTYTPTPINGANVTSSTGSVSHYTRNGNEVDMQVALTLTPTAATTSTVFNIPLPVGLTSNFSTATNARGFGVARLAGSPTQGVIIDADPTNDNLICTFDSGIASPNSYTVRFSVKYTIIP